MADFVLVLVWARLWHRLNSAGSQKGLLSCAHYVTTPSYYVLSLPLQDNSLNVTSRSLLSDTRTHSGSSTHLAHPH